MNNMTDLSHTKTSKAMKSTPLSRVSNSYKPWWQSVAEHNAKPKRVIFRKNGVIVKKSKPNNSVKPYCWMT